MVTSVIAYMCVYTYRYVAIKSVYLQTYGVVNEVHQFQRASWMLLQSMEASNPCQNRKRRNYAPRLKTEISQKLVKRTYDQMSAFDDHVRAVKEQP